MIKGSKSNRAAPNPGVWRKPYILINEVSHTNVIIYYDFFYIALVFEYDINLGRRLPFWKSIYKQIL